VDTTVAALLHKPEGSEPVAGYGTSSYGTSRQQTSVLSAVYHLILRYIPSHWPVRDTAEQPAIQHQRSLRLLYLSSTQLV